MARNFAVEFVRHNSRLNTGAVFALNGRSVAAKLPVEPSESETAGLPGFEWRVRGDIHLRPHLLGVRPVGNAARLRSEGL